MGSRDVPFDEAAFARCFAGLDTVGPLLLAVSGGPDSIALLILAARWVKSLGTDAPQIWVATVDHGLRPAARTEADMVAALAADYGLPHAILAWKGAKPASRIQERAREARYALLADHARAVGASHILTAHHADDQAETVLLRLGRGSGLSGLAGMRRLTRLAPNLTLVRPFLDVPKAKLVATCRAAGCRFVDDPSNTDETYARARLRAKAPALAGLGLDTAGLTRLATRLARADEALERETDRLESILGPTCGFDTFDADLRLLREIAPELRIRILRRAIVHSVPNAAIRLDRLESLAEAVWEALSEKRGHHATLAGARIVLRQDGTLAISVAPARRRGVVKTQAPP